MIAALLAAASATAFGVADYCGGSASRRAATLAVAAVAQLAGLPLVVPVLLVAGGPVPSPAALAWGAGAGVAGAAGALLLYRGLAAGSMAVVAPTTAAVAAALPVAVGIVLDGWPRPAAVAGIACALLGIVLVSLSGGGAPVGARVLGWAVAAGVGFALFYVLLDRAGADAGVWPVCAARTASAACVIPAALVVLRGRLGVPRAVLPRALAAGVLDMTANVLFAAALTVGQLAVVAPVSSLYPASTVLLALLVDRERLRPRQYVGLGLAGAALALVAAA